jgi:hypothetical protein
MCGFLYCFSGNKWIRTEGSKIVICETTHVAVAVFQLYQDHVFRIHGHLLCAEPAHVYTYCAVTYIWKSFVIKTAVLSILVHYA